MTETNASNRTAAEDLQTVIAQNRGWFMGLGGALILLGLVAVAFPNVTTIAAKVALGWIFLVGGVFQLVHAFSTKDWSGFFWNLLIGVAYVLTGSWLAFFPLTGIVTLTFLLAATFIAQGLMEFALALRLRGNDGWVWMLLSGIVAILVGVMIFAKLPSSAVWAIGLLAGVNMISSGAAYLALAFAVKN